MLSPAQGYALCCSCSQIGSPHAQVNLDGFALPVKKLKGTDPVETLDLSNKRLGVASTVVIASLIGVNGVLTSMDLSNNKIGGTGIETDYVNASKVQGSSFNVGDKVIYEGKEMVVSKGKDYGGDIKMKFPDMTGIIALADALLVNGGLTKME